MNASLDDDFNPALDVKTLTLFRQRLWPYIQKRQTLFIFSLLTILLSTACALVPPWLLGYTVDHVFVPKQSGMLLYIALIFIGVDLVRAATMIGQNYILTLLGQEVLHELRQDLLKQYQFYPLAEFNRTSSGRLVTRLVNDTSSLQDLFTGGLAVALGESVVILGIILWLIFLHPAMGLVCVSVFPVMIITAKVFGGKIRNAFREVRTSLSRLNAFLAENISGMPIIQIFNRQDAFKDRFNEVSKNYTRTQVKAVEKFAYFHPTITILGSISMSLLIWYGGYRSLNDAVTLGLLVTFMSYLQALYAPVRDITEKYNLFVSAMTSGERIFEFLDRPCEDGTDPNSSTFPEARELDGSIEFRNVWFKYDSGDDQAGRGQRRAENLNDARWILKDLSFSARPGEKIGIVGHTGAGKTTLSALLMRFYDFQRGEIKLPMDIRNIDKRSLRSKIGYIQQQPFLFSGTIEDNILLYDESRRAAFDRLPASAKACFESGQLSLKKEIYEKGTNLSAGEQQIISFLRALTQEPAILILDEATAHVDPITEAWITQVSNDAFKNRTVLVIAHRLATLKSVDRILVLHHGELSESGSHQELLAKGGIYRKLYEIQSRQEELFGESKKNATHLNPDLL